MRVPRHIHECGSKWPSRVYQRGRCANPIHLSLTRCSPPCRYGVTLIQGSCKEGFPQYSRTLNTASRLSGGRSEAPRICRHTFSLIHLIATLNAIISPTVKRYGRNKTLAETKTRLTPRRLQQRVLVDVKVQPPHTSWYLAINTLHMTALKLT